MKRIAEKSKLINLPPATSGESLPRSTQASTDSRGRSYGPLDTGATQPQSVTAPAVGSASRSFTGVGAMMAVLGQGWTLGKELEEVKARLAEYEGSVPTGFANRHETEYRSQGFAELKREIEQARVNVQPIKVRPKRDGGTFERVLAELLGDVEPAAPKTSEPVNLTRDGATVATIRRSAGKRVVIKIHSPVDVDEATRQVARHVLEEGPGALLASTRADVLDRVARQLVHALRQHGANRDVQVAILFEMSRELLLDRFNQRIAHLSVQAARLEKPGPAAQVWVLHVGNDEQVSLARLLARLVHDFPGSGVRLVMLASPSADAKLDTGPELQRLLRCMVIAEAGETGLEDSYSAGHEAADAEPASGAIAGPGPGGDVRRALPTAASAPDNRSLASPGRMLRLVTGGLLALGFSILVVMFLLPARPQRPAVSPVVIADPVAPAQE